MASEAQNRDQSFRSGMGVPGLAWDILQMEYGMRTKLWKEAMTGGMQWIGIPGLRGIGLGTSRNFAVGGSAINRLGIGMINKPIQGILNKFNIANDFVGKGISGFGTPAGRMIGQILGGKQTNWLKIAVPEGGREAVTKALETNWFSALRGKITPERAKAFEKISSKGIAIKGIKGFVSPKTMTGAAWKFGITQRLAPAAIWAGNLAFFASLTMPLFSAAGRFVAGGLETAERFTDKLNRRSVEFGGKIHQSYMNRTALTERSRALSELQRSRTNARTLIGNEGSLYHS